MRALGLVLVEPVREHDLRFAQAREELPVEHVVAHQADEGLAVPVLPRRAGGDVERSHLAAAEPI